ncbi:alpha/beta hydrolase [Candidatus Margulisiibacteriota bacterium]
MGILLGVLACVIGFNLLIEPVIEGGFIYFPSREIVQTPKDAGLDYQDLFLTAPDGVKLNCWHVDHPNSRKVILFFHGNGSNMSFLVPVMEYFYGFPVDTFFVDYRGYGRSEGKPSEKKLYQDARLVYQYLVEQKNYRPKDIVLWGWSLGASVAIDLAVDHEASALVVHSGITSARDMSARLFTPVLQPLIWLRSKFNNTAKLKQVKCPQLFIHSKADQVVPYEMGVKNYQAANEPKDFISLERNTHEEFEFNEAEDKKIREFVR